MRNNKFDIRDLDLDDEDEEIESPTNQKRVLVQERRDLRQKESRGSKRRFQSQ